MIFLLIDGLILSNGVAIIIRILEFGDDLEESAQEFSASWDTILFVGCKYLVIVNCSLETVNIKGKP